MTIRRPNSEDLRRLAEANHFEITDAEMSAFERMIPGLFESYDMLAQMPESHPTLRYANRDSGARPSPEEDPYNAILRRCRLQGATGGKLAGKRIGLKNNICVSGFPMTCASLILEHYVPESDATIVTRMLDEGAEINAILNLDNFAFSGAGDTSAFGPTLNPAQQRSPGGRVFGRFGGGAVLRRHRHDHRRRPGRFYSDTGVVLRGSGTQADPRSGALHRDRGYRQHLRPRGTDDADGAGRGIAAGSDRGEGPAGPAAGRGAGAGLHRGPWAQESGDCGLAC